MNSERSDETNGPVSGGVNPRAGAAGLRLDRNSSAAPGARDLVRQLAVAPPPLRSPSPVDPEAERSRVGPASPTARGETTKGATPIRDRPTTAYLSARVYEMLRMARARAGRSQVDIILDVVSSHYEELRRERSAVRDEALDPVLGIVRRTRRHVEDGRVVQLRFTLEEKAALSRLAKEAEMTVSSMISECLLTEYRTEVTR